MNLLPRVPWCRKLSCIAWLTLAAGTASAQVILVTEHRGHLYPVISARGSRPYVEVDGKPVLARGEKFRLHPVESFTPAFVTVKDIKVNTSSITLMDTGSNINHEFHFRAAFESIYPLKNVFIVLELAMENGGKSLFLYELGDLSPHKPRSLNLTAPTSYGLGAGNYKFHLFSEGLEVLHSQMPFGVREHMLDQLVARKLPGRADGPPVLLFGPTPEYPPALGKKIKPGHVVVELRIRPTGAVLDPKVIEASEPELAEPAITAARQWRFLPRIKGGRPVDTIARMPIEFTPPVPSDPKS